jgi:hypothetical protein
MPFFHPDDRVVAVNTDLTGPADPRIRIALYLITFPDGPLRRDRVYHVRDVAHFTDGSQGLFLTGLRVLQCGMEIPWDPQRFRKLDCLKGHVPIQARHRK